jgi:hypothetical protein
MLIKKTVSLLLIEPTEQHQNTDRTMNTSGQLRKLHEQVTGRILSSREGSRGSRGKSDLNPQPEVDDKVYLLTQRLPTRKTTRRLDNDNVVPSLISGLSGPDNYELRLPDEAKIQPGLHKSLFEPADLTSLLLTTFRSQTEEEDEFEVEKILERRGQRYLVKWKGYPHSENTWEPIQNLGNCQMILRQFRRTAISRRNRTAEPSRSTP